MLTSDAQMNHLDINIKLGISWGVKITHSNMGNVTSTTEAVLLFF